MLDGYDALSLLSRDAWESLEGHLLRVDHNILRTVVFVGRADNGPFVPYGTAFVLVNFHNDDGFQTLVTAKHVIDRIDSDTVWFRVNRRDGSAPEPLKLRKSGWIPHPDERVDLMVCPTHIPKEQYDFLHLPTDDQILTKEIINQHHIGVGDDVFIVGMFVSRIGETKNLPIIRFGNISSMPEEKIRTDYGYHHAYLVEARSIGGLSGSPVFAHMAPFRTLGSTVTQTTGKPYYLMGMMLGHNALEYKEDDIEILQGRKITEEEENERLGRLIPLNSGIGIVLPVEYILEALEQPKLKEAREEAVKRSKEKKGYVSDAARPKSEPPTKVDNPQHKEDFNRLLGEAVRGQKSGDQT